MLMVTLWGIIIAVASYPFHQKLSNKLGGKDKLASVIVVLIGLGIIIVPVVLFADSTIQSLENVAYNFKNGSINIPPVNDKVKDTFIARSNIIRTIRLRPAVGKFRGPDGDGGQAHGIRPDRVRITERHPDQSA
jgi:predicted PurR-regulated permease PerM